MTGYEIEKMLVEETNKMITEVKNRIAQTDSSQKTAMKAYKISLSVLEQAGKMVIMKFSEKSHDEMYYRVRENRVFGSNERQYFSDYKIWFDQNLDVNQKCAFLVYAHAVQMVHGSFLDKKQEELRIAKKTKSVEAVFALNMLIDTLVELLSSWEKIWIENGEEVLLETRK